MLYGEPHIKQQQFSSFLKANFFNRVIGGVVGDGYIVHIE